MDLLQRPRDYPVCVRLTTAQTRAIELLFALLEAPQHQAAMERGHGLCMPHFSQALARVPNQALRTLLLQTQSAKLACLAWEVEEAHRKAAWFGRPETMGWVAGLAHLKRRRGIVWIRHPPLTAAVPAL